MKKRSHYVVAFVLAAMLCLSCLNVLAEAPAGARDAELDKLFADSEAIRLEEIELNPGELSGPICAIDLSPDGKTVLWRYQDNDGNKGVAVVHEDGTAIPVHFNPSMGIGDPFGKEKTINGIFTKNTFPALEGLSWSPDGRYITFTYPRGIVQLYSADVPVLDTATGDVYFADSYARKASEDGFGIVTASQFSRDGNSIYYLLVYTTEGQTRYQFCRCTLQGDDKQVLYDVPQDDQIPFEIGAYSTLTEAADGSWLSAGKIVYDIRTGVANATGGVTMENTAQKMTGSGDRAVYDSHETGYVELIGNARATQDGNTVTGDKLRITNVSGRNSRTHAQGHVRMVYYPQEKKKDPAEAGAATLDQNSDSKAAAATHDAAATLAQSNNSQQTKSHREDKTV